MTTQPRGRVSWAVVWDVSLLLGALVLLGGACWILAVTTATSNDVYLLTQVSVGVTETDVIAALGQPHARISKDSQWREDPWRSFVTPGRPIDDHVLAYHLKRSRALYAYVDDEGLVTCVYVLEV